MGMLMHHTWQKQQEDANIAPVNEEGIPFAEPEEQVEEPVGAKEEPKKPVRRTTTATRRRKSAK